MASISRTVTTATRTTRSGQNHFVFQICFIVFAEIGRARRCRASGLKSRRLDRVSPYRGKAPPSFYAFHRPIGFPPLFLLLLLDPDHDPLRGIPFLTRS